MKDRPILFSAPMVRALLDGSKTQTRRVAKLTDAAHVKEPRGHRRWHPGDPAASLASPYGQPGDRLWVRETWAGPLYDPELPFQPTDYKSPKYCVYAADGGPRPEFIDQDDNLCCRWTPAIHMFRWASRITLEITRVRIERLHAINEVDAIAEGAAWAACGSPQEGSHKAGYAKLWESINGRDTWEFNPWVWVIEFNRVTP